RHPKNGKVCVAEPTRKEPPMGGFRSDPNASIVFAIEVYDDETGEYGPAPIQKTRQNVPVVEPTHTDDPAEALGWSLNYRAGDVDSWYKNTVAARATWGTKAVDAYRLVTLALNGKTPEVRVPVGDGDATRKDDELTMLAITKQQELIDKFEQWIWLDPERARAL